MPNKNKFAFIVVWALHNLNFFDFYEEKINTEKIILERLNKNHNFENVNHKLFLDENNAGPSVDSYSLWGV